MGNIRLDMTMSLDGFVAGPRDSKTDPMGVGGFRLFNWLDHRDEPGPHSEVYAEHVATRAFISGRRTYELADHWQGDHHDGVPIFILTHDVPDEPPPGTVRFVTDVRECADLARAAAGDADISVHGAGRPSRCCAPASSTSCSCMSCPSCWVRGGGCSTTCPPITSSSSWYASSAPRKSRTCATGSSAATVDDERRPTDQPPWTTTATELIGRRCGAHRYARCVRRSAVAWIG